MASRSYWINLFTIETWEEFLNAGGSVTGFSESRWSTVQRIKPGDYLLCYLTKVSRFVGILEATTEPYQDKSPIWSKAIYPSRVGVQPIVTLTPETAVPITALRNELSIFQGISNPNAWSGHVRGSPTKWSTADGKAVLQAVRLAEAHPIEHPIPQQEGGQVQTVTGQQGTFTVPTDDDSDIDSEETKLPRNQTAHDEIQWMLLKLGNDTWD
jgi:predicted RNA-binding protein